MTRNVLIGCRVATLAAWAAITMTAMMCTVSAQQPSVAQPSQTDGATKDSKGATDVKGRKYESGEINTEFSRVYIKVGKVGVGHEHGVVGQLKQGTLSLADRGSGHLVFDMTSFDADSPEARKYVGLEGTTDDSTRRQVNENMRGADVLSVNKFPTAEFRIEEIKPGDKKSGRGLPTLTLIGEFTLHGKTQPVRIAADVENKDGWLHIRGGFSILQTDYGMKPYRKMLGAVGVTDRLDIYGDLWIVP